MNFFFLFILNTYQPIVLFFILHLTYMDTADEHDIKESDWHQEPDGFNRTAIVRGIEEIEVLLFPGPHTDLDP